MWEVRGEMRASEHEKNRYPKGRDCNQQNQTSGTLHSLGLIADPAPWQAESVPRALF